MGEPFDRRLAASYDRLSAKLKLAADFVVNNPVDTATRSLRSVALESGVAPATFSRLARALDYDSFEELRDVMRDSIGKRVNSFSDRTERLQSQLGGDQSNFAQAHLSACVANLNNLAETIDQQMLDTVVDRLHKSRQVLLLGALGSTGVVEYMAYMASFFTDNWQIAGRMGSSLGSGLVGLGKEDALIIVTKPPFASRAIRAAELAQSQGVFVIVITDTHTCPALRHASASFIVATESPHFFSSYTVTMALAETIIGLLVGRSGAGARDRVAEVEKRNRRLEEVWDK